jgi:hypothetical protein
MNREVTNGVISDHLAKARWAGNSRINQEPNRIWVGSTHFISEESDQRRIGMAHKIMLEPPDMSSMTVWHEFSDRFARVAIFPITSFDYVQKWSKRL